MDCSKQSSSALDDKTSHTLNDSSKKKRLSVFVSGTQHKLLEVLLLEKNLKNIYGRTTLIK